MNSIESDFLKVIESGISHCQMVDDGDPVIITGEDNVATELAGKVERFIKWLFFEDHCFYGEGIDLWFCDIERCLIDTDKDYWNLSEIYGYWSKEIETKK